MTIKNQTNKILLISLLLLLILYDNCFRVYLYFENGLEINMFNMAFGILVYFLTYRFFELGGHWLLIPITYYLLIVGGGIIYHEEIINSTVNDYAPVIKGNLILSILLVAVLLYLYLINLKKNTSSVNPGKEP